MKVLTSKVGMSTTCLSCAEPTEAAPESAIGVEGKECVIFAETDEKTLLRENCLNIAGFSCCPSEDVVPEMRRIVLSPSGIDEFFVFRLRCGSRFLMDDFVRVELGLGGKPGGPALDVLGLGEVIFILVELGGNAFSKDLAGICKEERLGRLG